MMTKEASTLIVNFMTPGAGVLVLGHDHISYIVKYLVGVMSHLKNISIKMYLIVVCHWYTKGNLMTNTWSKSSRSEICHI